MPQFREIVGCGGQFTTMDTSSVARPARHREDGMSRDTGDGTETERLEWRKTPAAVVDFKTAIGRERDYEAVFLWEDHEAVD
jgi:hypothetical protein